MATTNVLNLPGDYRIKALNGNVFVDAGSNIESKAGSNIENEAGGDITNKAGSNIENEAAADMKNKAGGDIENEAGGDTKNKAGGNIENEAGGDIENKAGGIISFDANNIKLGLSTGQNIWATGQFVTNLIPKDSITYDLGSNSQNWKKLYFQDGKFSGSQNVGNIFNPTGADQTAPDWPDQGQHYSTTAQRQLASVYISGGLGVEKDLTVGGFIYGRISEALTATTSTQLLVIPNNDDSFYYPTFIKTPGPGQVLLDNTGLNSGLTYNPLQGKLRIERGLVGASDQSTSTTTGALVVTGGVGIGGNAYVGGSVLHDVANTGTIGQQDLEWAAGYVNNLYSKFIGSTSSSLTLAPGAKMTDIFGDIRVRGTNPIGTAPVVTNTLYVTVDGDDTNDGRAMDASRACRTIGGAINSPYYQPGTQILVSAGLYLEDNPLRLKPYTSVRGSDIRTTFIEPINKTQDLFHLDSGCYLNYMTFLNGRSGLLEGEYASGFNRGAYATAFPTLSGTDRINLYHSPYTQNCTNQSGPWLRDGTMFVPNQTVQVPAAVGTGTWAANTTSIVITVSTGTILRGMSINAGRQNPGFFNARTLLLANKPYLQEQVVAYINRQVTTATIGSIWYNFTYNQQKCYRDVGILVENTAYDAAFGGNEKSVESGLAYYNGVVSLIAGQESQTTAAIQYLRDRSLEVITNTTCTSTTSTGVVNKQVINWVLTGGSISTASIRSLYGIVTATIASPSNSPAVYRSTGPDAAFVSAEILMQANRTFIQENTLNYINNNLCFPPKNLKYNKVKCYRDVGLIVDSIALDMLYPTPLHSQSTFAGLQYFSQSSYVSLVNTQVTTTTAAISYLKDLAIKIIQNITPADDLIPRFTATTQITNLEPASADEVLGITEKFNIILDILGGDYLGWSDRIVSNRQSSNLFGVRNALALLRANKENGYFGNELVAYVNSQYPAFFTSYSTIAFKRDIGYIIDSVAFDLSHGGNRQSVQSGLSYYSYNSTRTIRDSEKAATTASFAYIATIADYVIRGVPVPTTYQTTVKQITSSTTATSVESASLALSISTITNIIWNGTTTVTWGLTPISTATTVSATSSTAFDLLLANKTFIQSEVTAWIDYTYNGNSFNYNEDKCYRDVGLIIDAVSQDILLGGNQKSLEAGLSYWNLGYNYVAGQVTTTTMAINYARDLALEVIANRAVTTATTVKLQTGTFSTQVINTFFQYGGDYMPQQAVSRNFGIITDIITYGPIVAPPLYAGGGLFALTGLNGSDVKISPKVTSITTLTTGTFLIGLNTATIGFGNNATLYIGDTLIFPKSDAEVEALSVLYTSTATSWNQRKVDPIGSMGGSLVDGAVISDISPIQSMVYDAFTQVNQGGKGVHITNNGYAQLVSVFTIFCSTAVLVENGGIASIVNSNANFGDLCLVAKGFGSRSFSGTVFNPPNRAYPFSPVGVAGSQELDPYYPNGFWPNRGTVEIFLPDTADRPHIGQVMEIIPPDGYLNEQSFAGFLNAQPSTGTLTTSTLILTNIDTTDVYIGNTVYIRDQFGRQYDDAGRQYAATGTIVTNVNYNAITLNLALTSGGGEADNPTYFTLYFCGNSYYTVQSSVIANQPFAPNANILAANTNPSYQGPSVSQITNHYASLLYLNSLTNRVINNTTGSTYISTITQVTLPLVTGGSGATTFINQRFGYIENILTATNITVAYAVVPSSAIKKTGAIVPGAGSAVTLLTANINFLAAEIDAFVKAAYPSLVYNSDKCKRDIKITIQRLIYDLETGGNYNSVMTGLSYWSRAGTHHIVELGEAVTRTELFPDGATVNFYQRSYISASGYVFEYVGAGINYGALPQRGIADPVQGKETVQLNSGKVFFTSTDQNGDFRIGRGLVISQATGVLSGRTFTQSLFANMTPFILAIE
jgi:hypothetical protein